MIYTSKKECGCEEKITTTGIIRFIENKLCEKHKNEYTEEKIAKQKLTIKNCDEELNCDICKQHLGWVHDFDLNGSKFICDNCKINN